MSTSDDVPTQGLRSESTVAYTDGACRGNPGPGGWAWAIPGGGWASGYDPATTNQRMEITAAYEAVRSNEGPVHVVSDSTYVVNCFRDRWWAGWQKRNWKNSKKEPVANRDLWEPFIELVLERDATFEWVKGHSGDPMNDLVDRLAVAASHRARGDSGDAPPSEADLGPEDVTGGVQRDGFDSDRPAIRDSRIPAGTLWTVVGVRSGQLPDSDGGSTLLRKLKEIISAQSQMVDDLVILTGLRPGAEQLGALAAEQAGVPFVVVLPYPDPAAGWADAAKAEFSASGAKAMSIVTLEAKTPSDAAAKRLALARRDGWLRSVSSGALVITDESDKSSDGQLKRFVEALGDDVWEVRLADLR